MKINTILKIVALCIICAATMIGGCLEVDDPVNANDAKTEIARVLSESDSPTQSIVDKYMNSVRSKYDKAQFDQSYIRDSDGFDVHHIIYAEGPYYSPYSGDNWKVYTGSTYTAYNDMTVDENHRFSVSIDHYSTIRYANEKMTESTEITFSHPANSFIIRTNLDLGDQSYKYISAMNEDPEESGRITHYSANIRIRKGESVGHIQAYGYSDVDECEEVVDYYTTILSEVLDNMQAV